MLTRVLILRCLDLRHIWKNVLEKAVSHLALHHKKYHRQRWITLGTQV